MNMASRIREYFERHYSFLKGLASIGVSGIYQPKLPSWMKEGLTPQEQDYLATKGDWEKVGSDLEKATKNTELNKE